MDSLPFWKVQNSWGVNWGDEGFVYFSTEDGQDGWGVCNMYAFPAEYVETTNER